MDESNVSSPELSPGLTNDESGDVPLQVVFAERLQRPPAPSAPILSTLIDVLKKRGRFPLLGLGILSLLTGLWAALIRIGWDFPPLALTIPRAHGPLMVAGFFGTVIALERAVVLQKWWGYLAPLFTAVGAMALALGIPDEIGRGFILLGSVAFVAIMVSIARVHFATYTVTLALGAVLFLAGNILWLFGASIPHIVLWWGSFLILTIAGERLELARFVRPSPIAFLLFSLVVGMMIGGLSVALVDLGVGIRITGLGMFALALWFLRYDITRRTIRQPGLTRFIAAALMSGYVWLGVSGLLGIWIGEPSSAFAYDAFLHTLFLGFITSMIFGHAPIILPAVTGRAVRYTPFFYSHLISLHVTLLIRLIGDLTANTLLREWGGLLNVLVLLLFLGNTINGMRRQ